MDGRKIFLLAKRSYDCLKGRLHFGVELIFGSETESKQITIVSGGAVQRFLTDAGSIPRNFLLVVGSNPLEVSILDLLNSPKNQLVDVHPSNFRAVLRARARRAYKIGPRGNFSRAAGGDDREKVWESVRFP